MLAAEIPAELREAALLARHYTYPGTATTEPAVPCGHVGPHTGCCGQCQPCFEAELIKAFEDGYALSTQNRTRQRNATQEDTPIVSIAELKAMRADNVEQLQADNADLKTNVELLMRRVAALERGDVAATRLLAARVAPAKPKATKEEARAAPAKPRNAMKAMKACLKAMKAMKAMKAKAVHVCNCDVCTAACATWRRRKIMKAMKA